MLILQARVNLEAMTMNGVLHIPPSLTNSASPSDYSVSSLGESYSFAEMKSVNSIAQEDSESIIRYDEQFTVVVLLIV